MKFVKLESVSSDIDYGLTESATDEDTGHKFLRITDIRKGDVNWNNVPFCECSESDSKKYELHDGDIVFARTGSVGNTGLITKAPKGAVFASYLIRIRPNQKNLDPLYLSYFFQTPNYWNQIEAGAVGAIQGGLNASKLKELDIPLLPLPEQRRIASLLSRADRLRRLHCLGDSLNASLLQSVFLEMFGDPATNNIKWDLVKLGEEITFLTSGSRGWAEYYSDKGDLFLRIQNVGANQLLLDDVAYVQAPDTAESRRTKVQTGDLLISATADLGRTAVIPENFPTAYINQHLFLLRLKTLNPVFVAGYYSTQTGKAQILRLDREGVKSGLNFDDVKSLTIFNPPLSEQEQFAVVVRQVESLRARAGESARQGEELFQSLLAHSFGEGV